jgi:hypothetical protein
MNSEDKYGERLAYSNSYGYWRRHRAEINAKKRETNRKKKENRS